MNPIVAFPYIQSKTSNIERETLLFTYSLFGRISVDGRIVSFAFVLWANLGFGYSLDRRATAESLASNLAQGRRSTEHRTFLQPT